MDGLPRPRDRRSKAEVEAVYRIHAPALQRYVRRLATDRRLSDAQLDVEGVVQEAFALLLRYPGPVDNPPAWLFTVARRLVGRAQASQRRVAVGDAHEHADGDRTRWTSLSRQASLEAMTEARAVMDAVAALPSRQRAATYLRHVQGWSLGEIGVYLDCASNTAGVHAHRGAQRIKLERQMTRHSEMARRRSNVASAALMFIGAALSGAYLAGWKLAGLGGLADLGVSGITGDGGGGWVSPFSPKAGSPWPAVYVILAVTAVLLVVVRVTARMVRSHRRT